MILNLTVMASSNSSDGQQPGSLGSSGSGGREEDKPEHYPKYDPDEIEVEEEVRVELPFPESDEYDPLTFRQPVLLYHPPPGITLTPAQITAARLKFDDHMREVRRSLAEEDARYEAYMEAQRRQEEERQEREGDRQR